VISDTFLAGLSVALSGFNKSDKSYFSSVAQLLGAHIVSASRANVLVAKRNTTTKAVAALSAGVVDVVRSDWLMACWAQAAKVDTAKFVWGVDNDDDDDDDDDLTLLTQRTTTSAAVTKSVSTVRSQQQQQQRGVARSVNDSMFSLNRIKKTANSWWARFVGDPEPQSQQEPSVSAPSADCRIIESPPVVDQPPSPTSSIDDENNDNAKNYIDQIEPPSPEEEFGADTAEFQFVDVDWSQPAAESQTLGAATQQAMALSQRFLPCVPVQFDDFAPSQRHVTFIEPRRDEGDGETQRTVDIRYGIPRAHKRLRADLCGEVFVEPAAPPSPSPPPVAEVRPSSPVVLSDTPIEPDVPEEPPHKRARRTKKRGKKKTPEPAPAPAEPVESDSPWASDVYEGASHFDARAQLVQRELARLEAEQNEKKSTKQLRALKQLSVTVVPIDVDATSRRRRTRKRKMSHFKPQ
jgi:hypothetical protein